MPHHSRWQGLPGWQEEARVGKTIVVEVGVAAVEADEAEKDVVERLEAEKDVVEVAEVAELVVLEVDVDEVVKVEPPPTIDTTTTEVFTEVTLDTGSGQTLGLQLMKIPATGKGVFVKSVDVGGQAEKSGVVKADAIIVEINGTNVETMKTKDLRALIKGAPNNRVKFKLRSSERGEAEYPPPCTAARAPCGCGFVAAFVERHIGQAFQLDPIPTVRRCAANLFTDQCCSCCSCCPSFHGGN